MIPNHHSDILSHVYSISKPVDFLAEFCPKPFVPSFRFPRDLVTGTARTSHDKIFMNYQSFSETQTLSIDPNRFTATTVRSDHSLHELYYRSFTTAEIPVDSRER